MLNWGVKAEYVLYISPAGYGESAGGIQLEIQGYESMELIEQKINGVKILKPVLARLDAHAAPEFSEAINQAIKEDGKRFVIDLSAMSFMDSSGLTCIVSIYKDVTQGMNGAMAVCGLQKPLVSLFRLTRLDKAIQTFNTAEEAAAALVE
jgi:anti-sigma B factor antagonist